MTGGLLLCDNLPKSTLSFLAITTTDIAKPRRYDIGEARENSLQINHNGGTDYVQKTCSNKQIEFG